jgi:hypothetical protein
LLKFPKELELILYCIQGTSDAKFKLIDNFSWNFFIELTAKHKVENIVNSQLPILVDKVPPKVIAIIKRLANKSRVINLSQANLIKDIVIEFDKHSLKALFIKGLTTYGLYPTEKYLRPARDIDFIIDWQDVKRTLNILSTMGFKLLNKDYKKSTGSLDLRFENSSILLELHWALWSKREEIPSKFNELWQKRKYVNRYNIQIPTIDDATHISYLCYHGFSHFWYRLFWLVDIQLILKNKNTDWQAVLDEAKNKGTLPTLYLAVELSANLFQTELPAIFTKEPMPQTKTMHQEIYQVLATNPKGEDFQPNNIKDVYKRIKWKLSGKSKYKLRTLVKLMLIR